MQGWARQALHNSLFTLQSEEQDPLVLCCSMLMTSLEAPPQRGRAAGAGSRRQWMGRWAALGQSLYNNEGCLST